MNRLRYSLCLLAVALSASSAFAQVIPPARDTTKIRPDTVPVPGDTTHAPVFADSVRPIPQLARIYQDSARGFSNAVWTWDREALLTETALTLGDLLERLPGIINIRSGRVLQPEAVTSMGGTANHLEISLDGYILDPLLEGSFDVSRLELSEIDNVRVERRLNTIRVTIETMMTRDTRPFSMIQAGVGQPSMNLFRGLLLVPKVIVGPLGIAIDRLDTSGRAGAEPADQFAGWMKWAYIRKGSGIAVEYRRAQTDRDPEVPWAERYNRTDFIVRARAQIMPTLVAEAFGGKSSVKLEADTGATGSLNVKEENTQIGARASFESPYFWVNGAFRVRDAIALPKSQLDVAAGLRFGLLSVTGRTTQSDWRTAGTASEFTVRAEAGPLHGLRVFGESTTSDRGASHLRRFADSIAVVVPSSGYRVGADVLFHGITLGGALLHTKTDSATTFGLPFDTTAQRYTESTADGGELSGRLPLFKGFAVAGNVIDWRSGHVSIYTPTRSYRVGLEYSASPLKSGNLQLFGRIEAVHRGEMLIQNPAPTEESPGPILMQPVDYTDAYVQIRIIDVRLFVRYWNLQGQRVPEVPGRPLGGPRVFYGVTWQFFN